MKENKNYVYILRCSDGTLYCGWTTDPEKRLKAHNSGHGAKYTRSRRPCELVYLESYDDKTEAMKREYAVKQLSREEKLSLIRSFNFMRSFANVQDNNDQQDPPCSRLS